MHVLYQMMLIEFVITYQTNGIEKMSRKATCQRIKNALSFRNYVTLQSLKTRPIYFDMQATTPLDFRYLLMYNSRVLDAMLPFNTHYYGNPHSKTHKFGWETEKAIDSARANVAALIGADTKEIIFTSGATEANNMAIKGVAHFYKAKKNHIITSQIVWFLVLLFRNINAFWTHVGCCKKRDSK